MLPLYNATKTFNNYTLFMSVIMGIFKLFRKKSPQGIDMEDFSQSLDAPPIPPPTNVNDEDIGIESLEDEIPPPMLEPMEQLPENNLTETDEISDIESLPQPEYGQLPQTNFQRNIPTPLLKRNETKSDSGILRMNPLQHINLENYKMLLEDLSLTRTELKNIEEMLSAEHTKDEAEEVKHYDKLKNTLLDIQKNLSMIDKVLE